MISDKQLFEELRKWRLERAKIEKVAAFTVFWDSALNAIAEKRPRNWDEMLALPNVGPGKMIRYGRELLIIVARSVDGKLYESDVTPQPRPQAESDDPLVLELRDFRRANSGPKYPAYLIFKDVCMLEIAARKPSTIKELYAIAGVRKDFAEKHGNSVLAIINRYRQ